MEKQNIHIKIVWLTAVDIVLDSRCGQVICNNNIIMMLVLITNAASNFCVKLAFDIYVLKVGESNGFSKTFRDNETRA